MRMHFAVVAMLLMATRTIAAPQPLTSGQLTTTIPTTHNSKTEDGGTGDTVSVTSSTPSADITTVEADITTADITTEGSSSSDEENRTNTDDSKSTVPQIPRYVPPLDPMKHMLMMAEAKKVLVSSTEPDAEVNTTNYTTTEKVTVTTVSSEWTEPGENKTTEQTSTDSITTTSAGSTEAVLYVDPEKIEESIVESNITPNIVDLETELLTTAVDDEPSTLSPNDNSSEIHHDDSVLIKSSELFSGKEDSIAEENTEDSKSTDSPTEPSESTFTFTSTNPAIVTETTHSTVSSVILEKEETKEIGKETPVEVGDQEPTVLTTLSTDETTFEMTTVEPTSIFPDKTSTTTLTSTTSEVIEEEEGLEKLSSSQSESVKNISVEESIAFRDPGLTLNISDVVPENIASTPLNESLVLSESFTIEPSEAPKDTEGTEATTFGIFTTIKELIFSTTTEQPLLKNEGESEIESILKDDVDKSTESPITELISKETESESTLVTEPVKVELLNSDTFTTLSDSFSTSTVESTSADAKADSIEITTETIFEELGMNKESLELSDDHPRTTELSESTSTAESKSTPLETVTVSTLSPDQTDSVLIEKFLVPQDRYVSGNNTDTIAAVQFLHYHDKASSEQCFKLVNAHWNYATNLTDENKKKQLEQTLDYALFHKAAWKNATSFAWKSFNDTLLRRWFKSLSVLGTAALPEDKLNEFNRLKAEMKNVYSTAKICPYVSDKKEKALQKDKDCNLTLEPDLARILTKSRNYDELSYVWKAWRDAAGKPIREKYLRFINLSNEAARLNGFSDGGDMWRESYESDSFEADLEDLWEQLRPLYENLHAYVRRKLIQQYGNDKIKEDGPIPAHLLGNMWAQSWVSVMDIAQPFPGKPSVDVTPIMEAKNLSALEMFKISEEFFISLGLKEMPEEFWEHSLIEKPKDREIICHASAWDFCNGKDYRIKQCTDITMEDLITVHHEMGHIQYFLQYARQPNVFREGANPGFHEAIGDVLALSVSTPKHLKSIGLLEEVSDDPEGDLNFLLFTALDKVSFLPSGYLIDLWRWGLFNGDIKPEEMNTKWWGLRLKYQGICPPVKRTDTDFDPGAKFHVPGNVPYIRYFVSFVIQFQFHKVLCDASGHTGPLYKCDIYRSKEAGQILSQVMELGSSEHWSEAMKIMTGGVTNRMDAGPILEYFAPLLEFLKEQNRNETLGWRSDDPTICP